MAKISVCAPKLAESFLTAEEAQVIMEQAGALDMLSSDERMFRQILQTKVEDKIDFEIKNLQNEFVGKSNFAKDAVSVDGEPLTMSQILRNREKRLFGRSSADTTRRVYKSTLIIKLDEYERMFGVEKANGVRATEQGDAAENELFRLAQEFDIQEHVKDIRELTPERVAKMVEGKTDVERAAMALGAYNEYARKFMHKHGVAVNYAKGFVIKRRYDWAKLETMGRNKFADSMLNKLNVKKTFGDVSDQDARKLLHDVYKSIETDANKKSNLLEFDMKGNSANNLTRKFVFKDAQAEYDVFNEMSIGGMREQIEENAWGMATTSVKVDQFGYDHGKAGQVYSDLVAQGLKDGTIDGKRNKFQEVRDAYRVARITQAEADFTGANSYSATGLSTMAAMSKTAIAIGKLGNTINVAILDPLDTARQNFYVNGEFFGGFVKYKKNMAGLLVGMDTLQRKELADHLGVVMNYLSSDSSMRVARGDLATSGGSKLARGVEKYGNKAMSISTFLPQQTSISKLSSALTGAQIFKGTLDKINIKDGKIDVSGLNKFELDTLKEYKIGARELDILKSVEGVKTWGDSTILSGKAIRDHMLEAHPQEMADKLGISIGEVAGVAIDLSTKYDSFVNDFFTRGTPTPELSAKTALLKGSGNEMLNVALGMITQFMDTPVMQLQSFNEMTDKLKRINGAGGKSLLSKDALQVMKAVGPEAFAQAVPHAMSGAAMYVGFNMMWSTIMGKESVVEKYNAADDSGKNSIMMDIMGRTSVLPFAFEFANNATSDYHNVNGLSTFKSPSVDIIGDMFDVMKPSEKPGSLSAVDFAKKQIPNAWYTQMIKNHILGD